MDRLAQIMIKRISQTRGPWALSLTCATVPHNKEA